MLFGVLFGEDFLSRSGSGRKSSSSSLAWIGGAGGDELGGGMAGGGELGAGMKGGG